MDERILAYIEDESISTPPLVGVSIFRVGSDKAQYDIFFTNRRIIAATVFSTSDLSDLTPLAGMQMMSWKKTRQQRRDQFKGKTLDEILNLHKDSFELPFDKIKSIKVEKGLSKGKIVVNVLWEGKIETIKLKIPKKHANQLDQLIKTYLPGKVI